MTLWYQHDGSGIGVVETEDETMLVIGDGPPNVVRMPEETPDVGGQVFRVLDTQDRVCSKCRAKVVEHWMLERGYCVAVCKPGCGFVVCKF